MDKQTNHTLKAVGGSIQNGPQQFLPLNVHAPERFLSPFWVGLHNQKNMVIAMISHFQELVIKDYVTSILVAVLQSCFVLGHSLWGKPDAMLRAAH